MPYYHKTCLTNGESLLYCVVGSGKQSSVQSKFLRNNIDLETNLAKRPFTTWSTTCPHSKTMSKPGILYVKAKVAAEKGKPSTEGHKEEPQIPDSLTRKDADTCYQYQNVDSSAEYNYLALYPLPDISSSNAEELKDSGEVSPGNDHSLENLEIRICSNSSPYQTHQAVSKNHILNRFSHSNNPRPRPLHSKRLHHPHVRHRV
jgi:hypothetical protein